MGMNFSLFFQTDIIRSIFFNFHYLPFRQAVFFPILVSKRFVIIKKKGRIILDCPAKMGLIKLGYLGLGTLDTKYDRTKWDVEGKLVIKGRMDVGRGSNICVGGVLEVGDGFSISGSSTIICKNLVKIGTNVLMSWDCLMMDTDFHPIFNNINDERINHDKPIIIGDNVWIGCRSTILKGAEVPSGSVLAAHSMITRKLTVSNSIYGGTSGGDILKKDIYWKYK